MLLNEKRKNDGRLSVRTSIIVWLSGAVLGWVVAVLFVYTILRAPDSPTANGGKASIQEATHTPKDGGNPAELSAIEPAAGPATSAKPSQKPKDKP